MTLITCMSALFRSRKFSNADLNGNSGICWIISANVKLKWNWNVIIKWKAWLNFSLIFIFRNGSIKLKKTEMSLIIPFLAMLLRMKLKAYMISIHVPNKNSYANWRHRFHFFLYITANCSKKSSVSGNFKNVETQIVTEFRTRMATVLLKGFWNLIFSF